MNRLSRREQEKETMRRMILEAATKIILADGYEKLSMRKIAAEIEYSPTTIYLYYKDKSQIVDDICHYIYQKIVLHTQQWLQENSDKSLLERLKGSMVVFIYSMTEKPEMGKAVLQSGSKTIFGPGEGDVADGQHGAILLWQLLSSGTEQNLLRPMDKNAVWMIISALLGFSFNAMGNQYYDHPDWEKMVDSFADILLNGLKA